MVVRMAAAAGILVALCSSLMFVADAKCGYESCNREKPGMVNVHLVPHTHNDPGWLVTVDQYYYRKVQFILQGVIERLEMDPNKRFTYVEMSFFTRWWNAQDRSMKQRVKNLVDQGRLEFTLGGWVMNDEAASHYTAIIDQHTLGFDFLRTNFGQCGRTKIGWQIDPFGHSREQASLFAQFGFDGLFFGRLDHQDKANRQAKQTMEMVWHGSPDNLGASADLFTGVLPNGYDWPRGFHFDVWDVFQEDSKQSFFHDDPNLHDYNVDDMVNKFFAKVEEYKSWYGTNHVIATMGSDFDYVDALLDFREIDKLIKYVNAKQTNGSKVNLLYSTPSCYLHALHGDGRTYTTKADDFFPYASENHTYWTGFFTSRPAQKVFTRRLNRFLQGVKQLTALAKLDNRAGVLDKVYKLAKSISLGQHHDAITGTEKQVVAFDYAERMSAGQAAAKEAVNVAFSTLKSKSQGTSVNQVYCDYLNVSVCTMTGEAKNFEVTMYNPLTWPVNYTARVPVTGSHYQVLAHDGKTVVPSDVFPVQPTPVAIRPKGMNPSPNELVFTATLPPLGFVTYFVQQKSLRHYPQKVLRALQDTTISGKYVEVQFDTYGQVKQLTNKASEISAPFSQNFFYYRPFVGNNSRPEVQSSGAYIFRPRENTPVNIELTKWAGVFKGSVVQEARQRFSDWLNQTIRVYQDKPYVEFEWTVGPLPTNDGGKEVITRYNLPGWGNKGVFYTDSNGRELLERRLNYRPTWQAHIDEPVAGNYYPVDAHIHIKSGDARHQFTVLVDRAEGGTSLNDGDVELMLHRRLMVDDNFGVGQALDEPGLDGKGLIIRGSHYVLLDTVENSAWNFRPLAQEVFLAGEPSFTNTGLSADKYTDRFNTKWSGLVGDLPPQVHLLTLERFRNGGPVASPNGSAPYLVRFEHFYEVKEDAWMSQPVTFDIKNLFQGLVFVDATELVLGGNAAQSDIERLVWKTQGSVTGIPTKPQGALHGSQVTLKPMQIVTLQVNYKM